MYEIPDLKSNSYRELYSHGTGPVEMLGKLRVLAYLKILSAGMIAVLTCVQAEAQLTQGVLRQRTKRK